MQAWKIKRNNQGGRSGRTWRTKAAGVFFLFLTLALIIYDFPVLWNRGASWVSATSGISVHNLPDAPFRLGLDLQGGTHLVYNAEMKDIPAADQANALEGVRDVIERRANAFGVAEPVVQTVTTGGIHHVIVELAGVMDVAQASKMIGETPVLEFKEPGAEVTRELTESEKAALAQANKTEKDAAKAVLARAQKGEDFAGLITELSVDPNAAATGGALTGLTDRVAAYAPIVAAIKKYGVAPGRVVPEVIETAEGLNVIKFVARRDEKEMLLSHLLKCFEGKTNCQTGISALDASLQINKLKDEATAANFADLAKANSDDPSVNGDLGWVVAGDTVPAFELAAKMTPKGGISDVVETEFGYHLIYKRDERQAVVYDIERVLLKYSTAADVSDAVSPWKNTGLSGKQLKAAAVEFDQSSGAPHVALRFNDEGAKLFAELTAAHVGEPIAIFLDGEAITTPTVQQAIYGGEAIITGNFTVDEAKLLAQRLNAGALPVPVELVSQQTVGPTLGFASLEKSILAAIIGFALVALYMILLYRLPGLLAVVALVFYLFLNIAIYRVFDITITLAGIAGLILSVGMAVDANVLIIERMKEEYGAGRDLLSTIAEGFRRAWPAIRDGNLTTILAAIILFWFSSSFIRGFALTLAIGVSMSMFSALTVSRSYFLSILPLRLFSRPWLYSFKKPAAAKE